MNCKYGIAFDLGILKEKREEKKIRNIFGHDMICYIMFLIRTSAQCITVSQMLTIKKHDVMLTTFSRTRQSQQTSGEVKKKAKKTKKKSL